MISRTYALLLLSLLTMKAQAWTWTNLWQTPDQQAQHFMNKGKYQRAEETFQNKDWAATAAYRSGHYEQAAKAFEALNTTEGYYNQGNALAHLGQYEKALEAYDKTLDMEPNHQDALYNRKIVADLLKKEKQKKQEQDQQNKNQQNNDQQNKDQQNKDQQNKDQQNKDQQNKDQQNKDQQNKDQQNKDQQNKDQQNKDQQNKDQNKDNKASQSIADREKQQAKEQWLRIIPDDPGGLMREKFLRDHLRRQRGWYQ